LHWNLLFEETCLGAGGTESEGRLESYVRIFVASNA